MELRQADYTPEELSKLVCYEIIRLAGESAAEDGMGWADIEETLTRVFSDVVEVKNYGYTGITTVGRVSEADSA
jgi:hypothetical protein